MVAENVDAAIPNVASAYDAAIEVNVGLQGDCDSAGAELCDIGIVIFGEYLNGRPVSYQFSQFVGNERLTTYLDLWTGQNDGLFCLGQIVNKRFDETLAIIDDV